MHKWDELTDTQKELWGEGIRAYLESERLKRTSYWGDILSVCFRLLVLSGITYVAAHFVIKSIRFFW